mgnify:CR=1 FL=1
MTDYLTVKDIAARYDVTKNTVRNWCKEFAGDLSEEATTTPRQFTEADQHVFALIADMRNDNRPYKDIHAALANDQQLNMPLTPPPAEEETIFDFDTGSAEVDDTDTADRQERALATMDFFQTILDDIRTSYEHQVAEEKSRSEKLETQLEEERAARLEAEKRATAAEVKLQEKSKSFIDRLFGR